MARAAAGLLVALCCFFPNIAGASFLPFNTNTNMNIGIGTSTPQAAFVVTNGNVGVGTWTASQSVDVIGTVKATYFIGNGSGLTNISASAAGSSPQLQYNNGGSLGAIGSGGTNGTNIGVGTVSFVNRLNIVGNVGIATLANSALVTSTMSSPAALVVDGNVGIGRNDPERKLDVSGVNNDVTIRAQNISSTTARYPGFEARQYGASGSPIMRFVRLRGNSGSPTEVQLGDTLGQVQGAGATDTSWSYAVGAGIDFSAAENFSATNLGTNIIFNTASIASASNTEKMRLTANGNLGIGTSTPGSRLSVLGGASYGSYATQTSPLGGIITSGNVGIGTFEPTQLFDVIGTAKMTGFQLNNSPAAGAILMSNALGVGTWIAASAVADGTGTASPGGSSPQLQYNNGGSFGGITSSASNGTNIGIGTVSLVNRVNMAGSVGVATLANSAFVTTALGSDVGLAVDGKVGIGTSTPGYPLDVRNSTASTQIHFSGTNADSGGYIVSTDANGLYIGAGVSYSGSQWIAKDAGPTLLQMDDRSFGIFTDAGLVVGGSYTPTARFYIATGTGYAGFATSAPDTDVSIGPGADRRLHVQRHGVGNTAGNSLTIASGGATLGSTDKNGGDLILSSGLSTGSGTSKIQFKAYPGIAASTTDNTETTVMTMLGNGNVGVGTFEPTQLLDVIGTAKMTYFQMTTSPAAGSILMSNTVGVGSWIAASAVGDGAGSGSPGGSSPQLQYNNGGSFGGISGTASNGTNIGIGTVSLVNRVNMAGNVGIATLANSAFVTNALSSTTALAIDGNVGIGSNVPTEKLDVVGTAKMTYFQMTTSPAAGSILMANTVGVGSWIAASAVGDGAGSGSPGGSSPQLQYNNGGSFGGITSSASDGTNIGIGTVSLTKRLNLAGNVGIATLANSALLAATVDSAAALAVDGNVGIGTWVPGNVLEIVHATPIINLRDSSSTAIASVDGRSANMVLNISNTAKYIEFRSNSNPLVRIVGASGNMGVGTGLPASKLVVVGNVGIATGVASSYVYTAAPAGGMIVEGNVGIGTVAPQTMFTVMNGNVGIGTFTAAGGNLIVKGNGNVGVGTSWPGVALDVNGALRSTATSGTSYFGGNVGFGSLAPGAVIDVQGTTRTTAFQLSTGAAAGSILMSNTVGVGSWIAASAVASGGSTSPGGSSPQLQYNNGGSFGGISGTASNGTNIGIGTVSLVNRLNLAGNVGISTLANSAFVTTALSGATVLAVDGNVGIGTVTPQGALTVMGGGNVGIGTWLPDHALDIKAPTFVFSAQATTTPAASITLNNSQVTIDRNSTNGNTLLEVQSSDTNAARAVMEVQGNNGATEVMWAGADGNVGIGTMGGGLGSKLNVAGNIGVGTSNSSAYVSITGPSGGMIVEGNVGIGTFYAASRRLGVVGNVGIATLANSSFMTTTLRSDVALAIDGNVGIGTRVPAINSRLTLKDGHLQSQQTTAPTVAAQAAAGVGAACTLTNATDVAGTLTLDTGTSGWSTGPYCTITFNKAYETAPIVLFSPADANAAQAWVARRTYATSSTTTFDLNFGTAHNAAATANYSYIVIETQ